MEPVELVFKTLTEASDPLSAGQIEKLSGLERKAVDKAMKTLKDEGKIVSPKRCYWTPK